MTADGFNATVNAMLWALGALFAISIVAGPALAVIALRALTWAPRWKLRARRTARRNRGSGPAT